METTVHIPRLPTKASQRTPKTIPAEVIDRLNLQQNRNIKLSHLKDPDLREFTKTYASRIISNIDNNYGLFLYGPPGVGKSSILSIILKYGALKGCTGLFIDSSELISAEYTPSIRFDDFQSLKDRVRSVNILAIDDLGKERNNETVISTMNSILLYRSKLRYGITLISSNVQLHKTPNLSGRGTRIQSEFEERYGEATSDLIRQMCYIKNITGESFRETYQDRMRKIFETR